MTDRKTNILLNVGIVIALSLFAFSLFKNISYPLLWNDEASTAMFGERVLEYGYPKTYDEKNSLYLWSDANHDVGIRNEGSVYVAEGWTQYYLAAFGDYFANQTKNIYTKMAMARAPFALVGFLAVIIFGFTISLFFENKKRKAFIAFFIFELLSISLILHLREARYYSLVLLFSSVLFYVYLRYTILKNINYKHFVWVVTVFVALLFHTHYPVAAAFIFAFGIHALILSFSVCEKKLSKFISNFFKLTAPLFASLIFIIPSLIYFKTFTIAKTIANEYALNVSIYFHNIFSAFSFFAKFEFLYLAIFLKILLISPLFYKDNVTTNENKVLIKTSNFLSLFFCVYILIIARTLYMFERYVIVLQPILVCIILLDIFLCLRIFDFKKRFFMTIILIAAGLNLIPQIGSIKGHLYELIHQYKGPLDFAIPYIQEKFKDPSKIIIATNYEENSYMYYLNSKTIVGYVGNNLAEDRKLKPDVIIYRKHYNFDQEYIDVFNTFLRREKYQKTTLQIFDYPVNNIPELNYTFFSHLYKTKFTDNNEEKLDIYLKK